MILTGSQRRTLAWQAAGVLCGLVVLVGLASSLQVRATRSIVELTGSALAARQQLAAVDSVLDVLQDADIRQGIKEYANWPTIPQLYIKGEFIGGSDIMTEMYQNGELKQLL